VSKTRTVLLFDRSEAYIVGMVWGVFIGASAVGFLWWAWGASCPA
jgi:hypothetical protein